MGLQKWLRIVLPEIQLIDFIQKEGFRGKKQRTALGRQTMAGVSSSIPSGSNIPGPHHAGIPQSSGAIKEAARDVTLGIKNLTLNRSNEELDHLFNEIKHTLNSHVLGQGRYIDDLLVCFKKSFLARDKGSIQNTILLCGPSGTGKNLSLNIMINELYKKKLTPYKSYSTMDLSQYGEKDIHTNFIVDCSALFSYGIGTVCFTGVEKAHSVVISYVTKLFRDGYFRTPEGIVVSASDYFLILYMDAEVNLNQAGHQIPVSIADKVPPGLLREIQSFSYTEPLTVDSLRTILHTQLHKASATLQRQAQLNIQFDPNVYSVLAERLLATKKYGEAVHDLVENNFYSVLLDARARGKLSSSSNILVKMEDHEFFAEADKVRILLKTISIIKEETLEDILNELNSLVGLDSVKTFVHELLQTVKLQKQREALGGKITPMALHIRRNNS
ncbi:hypothetical protein M3226_25595 [Neobacillus cucumis]|uniref:hypothetical protein n=1 Tax=Neobacillus cucumis TaxID=1740721 RepID=UPI00203F9BFF|nr:hypothetical protein [Neobacillus cucumis]MCM3729019.1 hypothetical protein [Neobacillus cucumis]